MKKLMLLTLAFLVIFSCTKDDPISSNDPPHDETITEKNILDFRHANLAFAQAVYKEIISQSTTDENIMISPISISIAFAMLNNGAANNTKDQIKDVLGYGEVPDYCVNNMFLQLANKLDSLNNIIDLRLANSAWFDNDFPVRDTYVELTKDYFDAEIRNLDLGQTASIDAINAWVSNKTDGKIQDILDHTAVGAAFFLVNAINFQGFWKVPFDADATENRRFYNEDGTYKLVSTMIDTGINEEAPSLKFEYFYGDSVRAVKMPYGDSVVVKETGKDVSMYVFVPTGTLEDFMNTKFTVENWNSWMGSFKSFDQQFPEFDGEFNFSMPKFKFGFESNLIPILKALGMTDAFSGLADFSGMTEAWQSLFIGLVKHKSFIDVNEEGTSAAAVTIIGGYTAVDDSFLVNKPFFFAIRDDLTGTILFMGQVYDPQY